MSESLNFGNTFKLSVPNTQVFFPLFRCHLLFQQIYIELLEHVFNGKKMKYITDALRDGESSSVW